MKKVLVADDEQVIRDGLSNLIRSVKGFEVVAACKNGKEALKTARKEHPDIIITDIRMPGMSGLQFMEEFDRKYGPKFIIISGHEEFEYARQAHKLGAYDYILKPIDYSAFLETLEKAALEIDNKRRDRRMNKEQIGLLAIQPSVGAHEAIDYLTSHLELDVHEVVPVVLGFTGCFYCNETTVIGHLRYLSGMMEQWMGDRVLVFSHQKRIVLLFLKANTKEVIHFLLKIARQVEDYLGAHVYFGIGRVAKDIYSASSAYLLAVEALSRSFYHPEQHVLVYLSKWDSLGKHELYSQEDKKKLVLAISELNYIKAIACAERFFQRAKEEEYPLDILISYIQELYRFCYSATLPLENKLPHDLHMERMLQRVLYHSCSWEELLAQVRRLIMDTVDLLCERPDADSRDIIGSVIQYLHTHYRQEITLDSISEHFHVNKSYFCKIFKEHAGKTFNNYLIELRIEKAKLLIMENNYKIYEIADMVGFRDAKYFARIFRVMTGTTPTNFMRTQRLMVL